MYSNVSANDQLEDLFAVSGIPLEPPPPSDERHLSFKSESGGANYVSTDSNA
jgi:hypothetical protein